MVQKRHQSTLDESVRLKKLEEERQMELDFLEEQVNVSQLNEFKLRMRQQELQT